MNTFTISILQRLLRVLGQYRIWRIFHELRQKNRTGMDSLLEYILNAEMPERPFNYWFLRKYFVDLISSQQGSLALAVPTDVGTMLDEIPSETTSGERRLLWHFFASIWDGSGDVVEIGPFLGGTSRAIALGMAANCKTNAGRLLTFDRFEHYYSPNELKAFVRPLQESGLLSPDALARIGASSSFLEIYKEIHGAHLYGKRIVPVARPVPDTAEQAQQTGPWFHLPPDTACSAFFVDGCKSWFGTKYFMKACCGIARPGARFLFQDYLQFTCFWLPSFIQRFNECFRLLCYVDQTFVFDLIKPLPPERIEAEYPDKPESWDAKTFETIFAGARLAAEARDHREALVKHAIQYGGALAYIGEKDLARSWFAALMRNPLASEYAAVVQAAAAAPTYRPNGWGGEPVKL